MLIVSLQLNFWFYCLRFEFSLGVLFVCFNLFYLSFSNFFNIGVFLVSFNRGKCFFYVILFFANCCWLSGKLHLAIGLIDMHSATASLWVVTKFSYSSLVVYLSDISWRVSNFVLSITVYGLLLSHLSNEDKSYREHSCNLFLTLTRVRPCWDRKIFLQKRSMPHSSKCYHLFLVYKYIILWLYW